MAPSTRVSEMDGGGESTEGSWYQYSMYRLRYALNMLHTAGYNDRSSMDRRFRSIHRVGGT